MKKVIRIIGWSWCYNVIDCVDVAVGDLAKKEEVIAKMRDEYNIKEISVNEVSVAD